MNGIMVTLLGRGTRSVRALHRYIVVVVAASCATLLAFQVKLAVDERTRLPPWKQPGGRESRAERHQRIMERQIFRDNEEADHRHDELPVVAGPASGKLPWFFSNGTEWPRPSSRLSRLPNLWPDPQARHDDRIVAQLMYLPPGYKGQLKSTNTTYTPDKSIANVSKDADLKTIVLQGSWYDFFSGRTLFLRDRCPVDKCRVYQDSGSINIADAVIFKDSFNNRIGLTAKPKGQVWILYLLENPQHTLVADDNNNIDWTATYRKDSDIVTPYEKFVLFDPLVKSIKRDRDYASGKTKMVAWFVSNCYTTNNRLQYGEELQKHVQVDIYGDCGTLQCSRYESEKCYQMLESDYMFYLAFENANCRDYITEKFFNALRHNVVPIVMGAPREDYLAAAPYHSYIHVDDFASPKHLAEYLLLLRQNRTLYNEYFLWKGTGEFINTYFWCRLCAMLHAPPPPSGTSRRALGGVYNWWTNNMCNNTRGSRNSTHLGLE